MGFSCKRILFINCWPKEIFITSLAFSGIIFNWYYPFAFWNGVIYHSCVERCQRLILSLSVLAEMPLLLSAVLSVLLIHPSLGAAAVDSLSSIAIMDPRLGVPLLLTIMFYSNIFTRNDVVCHDMLVSPPFGTGTLHGIVLFFCLHNM